MLLDIAFNLPLYQSFTYLADDSAGFLQPGMRVVAPFGKKILTGIITSTNVESDYPGIRPVIDIVDVEPLIRPSFFQLARWISDYYMTPLGQVLPFFLPKGINDQFNDLIHLKTDLFPDDLTARQKDLLRLVVEIPGQKKEYYHKKYGHSSFHQQLNRLVSLSILEIERERSGPDTRPLMRQAVTILAEANCPEEFRPELAAYLKRRPEVADFLKEHRGLTLAKTVFLQKSRMASATLQKMAGWGVCRIDLSQVERQPGFEQPVDESALPELTADQKVITADLLRLYREKQFKSALLHGVTGSGKTRVYIEILKQVLESGRDGLILVPEIALTPQTVNRFRNAFREKIAIFHSQMSLGERYDAWMACFNGSARIAIGPRSALFAPLANPGLIVVDEEHDASYKQSDSQPRYHARDVALYWGKANNALVILGSATPSMESYHHSQTGKYHYLFLENRINQRSLPPVELVDMRATSRLGTAEGHVFSKYLAGAVEETVARGEQVILLQNRRGFASFLQCSRCGYIPVCPNCDISLTYHKHDQHLHCHHCNYQIQKTTDCAYCGGTQIEQKGVGTQRIEQALAEFLPAVRIIRLDQDTTRQKNSHDRLLTAFRNHQADVLIGTQMIAKGLDFPLVTLAGVISADIGLAVPDIRAFERVFQLLTQLAGRAGRGELNGRVIVQTYWPGHFVLDAVSRHDYLLFVRRELAVRQKYAFPPFTRIIRVEVNGKDHPQVISLIRTIKRNFVLRAGPVAEISGPSPAIWPKLKNRYFWQFYIKIDPSKDPAGRLTRKALGEAVDLSSEPFSRDFQVNIDVDPLSLN